MNQDDRLKHLYERNITDHLKLVSRGFYLVGSVMFFFGTWIDYSNPGQVVIPPFAIADDPHPNSGLFIGGLVIVLIGFAISRINVMIYNRRYAPSDVVEHDQEWVVDVD